MWRAGCERSASRLAYPSRSTSKSSSAAPARPSAATGLLSGARPADRLDASRHLPMIELGQIALVLREDRDKVLGRWLVAAAEQPFHRSHPEAAVADHIPRLYDAIVAALERAV